MLDWNLQRRMIDNGIGCDVVCLTRRPLHTVPLFQVVAPEMPDHVRYSMPHWIDISYYNRSPSDRARPYRLRRFVPCCQLADLHTGLVEVSQALA